MLLRAACEFGRRESLVQARDIDEAILVEAEARFGRENSAHGFVDAAFGNAARIARQLRAPAIAASGTGGISSTSDTRFDGAHGCFAGRVEAM